MLVEYIAPIALLFLSSFGEAAFVNFNDVIENDFEANGQVCPIPMRYNVSCPLVCASEISYCPEKIRPSACPAGQVYCGDGSCKLGSNRATACKNVSSRCSCKYGFSSQMKLTKGAELVPCLQTLRVNVPNYAQNDLMGDAPLNYKCSSSLEMGPSDSLGSAFLLQCAPQPVKKLKFTEPEFLSIYAIILVELCFLVLYHIYRQFCNSQFQKNNIKPPKFKSTGSKFFVVSDEDLFTSGTPKMNDIRMSGYQFDSFGYLAKISIILTSLGWLALLGVFIGDYYGVFSSLNYRDRSMLLVDQETLSRAFVIVWHITTIWFITLQIQSVNLKTYFMARDTLGRASHILVEKKIDTQTVSKGMSQIMTYLLSLEKHFLPNSPDVVIDVMAVSTTSSGRRYFEFECVRYVYNPTKDEFVPYEWSLGPKNSDIHAYGKGLSANEASFRHELAGPNEILFKGDTFWGGIKKEFMGMFYIYQLMQLIIWYYYAYYYMAAVVNLVIIVSGVIKVVVSRKAQAQIISMAKFTGKYHVLRDGKWRQLDSSQLVPGDVFEVKASEAPIPVDCILISGGAVMDESSLTGEALPVAKFSLKNNDDAYHSEETHPSYGLFAGCKILEVKPIDERSIVKAFVTATGASTAKGTLVRDILYPTPFRFVFTEHLKIVVFALILWGFTLLGLSIFLLDTMGTDSWFYGMTSISQVLSPLLPAVLVIGQSIATERLRKKGIMCLDLNRITLAGKVKFFCFDKTGTLTKEGLDFMGAQYVNDDNSFDEVKNYFDSFGDVMKRVMLTCHTLATIGDKFVGNFVDIEMFRITSATLVSGDGNTSDGAITSTVYPSPSSRIPPLRILKRFEFSHKHAYMSTIVRDPSSGRISIYLKGSFQRIKEIVNPETLPDDCENMVNYHSSRGFYVIATACCELPAGTSSEVAIRWPREFLEKDACFVGLMLFRNEVKPDTAQALSELRQGGCRVSMITGDNVNTAIYIGWASGMIKQDWQKQDPLIVIGDAVDKEVVWKSTDDDSVLSSSILDTLIQRSRKGFRPIEIAITGKAFHKLITAGWLQKNLLEVRIFANMKPMDKIKCIRLHMERGITAMCGDGGNDAGALKAAHTGIALSDAESSVVGHFSSTSRSLMCCVELLKEARCSLDVSFASYRYLMMYGEILAFVGMVQYFFKVSISQASYILIDGSTVPLSWALTMATPTKRLLESRPTAKLLGFETVLSVLGQIVIDVAFMAGAVTLLMEQPFYRCHAFDTTKVDLSRWWELADNYEAMITSLVLIFQIFNAAAALNLGWKYRQGSLKNWRFVTVYALLGFLLCYITLADPNPLGCLFRFNCGTKEALESLGYTVNFKAPTEYHSAFGHNVIPPYFRYMLLALFGLNFIVLLAWEGIVIQGSVRKWAVRKWKKERLDYRY